MTPSPRPDPHQTTLLAAFAAAQGSGSRSPGKRRRAGPLQGARPQGLLYWTPVLVALLFFAQVSLLGLRPALKESGRLGRAEAELLDRREAQLDRLQRYERILRAQSDPIYLERERRLLLDPSSGLLAR